MKQEYVGADKEAVASGATESYIWFHPFCIFTNPDKMRLMNLRDFSHFTYVNLQQTDHDLETFKMCYYCSKEDQKKNL